MNSSDFERLEAELAVPLPEYYRATMLAYPFVGRGDIEHAELVNSLEGLLELNRDSPVASSNGPFFVIGTDLSEEIYYIKPSKKDTSVFCFQLETGEHHSLYRSWDEYITFCHKQIAETEEDERLIAEKAAKKKWWHLR